MPASTSAASASCGTHLGLTKLVASMVRSPVADSLSTSATLSAVLIIDFSFCSPSRGPTSTMRTWDGMAMSGLQRHEYRVAIDELAGRGAHLGHRAIARRLECKFHLHRLEHDQLLACSDAVTDTHVDQHHAPRHRGQHPVIAGSLAGLQMTIHPDRTQHEPPVAVMDQYSGFVRGSAEPVRLAVEGGGECLAVPAGVADLDGRAIKLQAVVAGI